MQDRVKQVELEGALEHFERDAQAALKAAATLRSTLQKCAKSAAVGDLKSLKVSLDAAEVAVRAAGQSVTLIKQGWQFDEEAYFREGLFVGELIQHASRAGLPLKEDDGRVFSYPVILHVLAGERAVRIDRKVERKIRPSVLVKQLKALKEKPARTKPEAFVEALKKAYDVIAPGERTAGGAPPVVKLPRLYQVLTLLPGSDREYGMPEFKRDIYMVDKSGHDLTQDGSRIRFIAGSHPGQERGALSVVTETGGVKWYSGIQFVSG